MKLRFVLFSLLLLFARGCDFYSTSLWFFQPGGMAGETNPLTRFLGVGWNGLIVVNVLVVALVLGFYYYYCFHYRTRLVSTQPRNFREYASALYFGRNDRFGQVLYKHPNDKSVMAAHFGYVLVRVIIVGSFLATIHNLCQYYQLPFYDQFRTFVGRPLYVIYGLIVLALVGFGMRFFQREYQSYLRASN